jgi:hypothetical protein
MSLPMAPNVTFDVYRGYSPASPYAPALPAAACKLQGFLRQHVRNGRFGFTPAGAQPVHWTTILDVILGTDIRSAYNAQLNTFNEANGDTLLVHDYPTPGTCCAFVVVMVQLRKGYLRCYLDRAQPSWGVTCPDCPAPRVHLSCCPAGQTAPMAIVGRISNTSQGSTCLQGVQFTLNYSPNVDGAFNAGWSGIAPTAGCPSNIGQVFQVICSSGVWFCRQSCGVNWNAIGGGQVGTITCNPFSGSFSTAANGCYGGGLTLTLSET